MKNKIVILLCLLFLSVASFSYAASVSLSPGPKGVFYLKANDFVEVGGVEVEVSYDTNTLSNPRISQGSMLSSAMFIPNPKFTASSLKVAAMSLSAINGSGDLAVITFDVKGNSAGTVNIARSKLAAATGKKIPQDSPKPGVVGPTVSADGQEGANAQSSTAASITSTTTTVSTDGGVSSSGSVSGAAVGTISLPSDQMSSTDRNKDYQPLVTDLRKDMTTPASGAERAKAAAEKKAEEAEKEAAKKFESFDGVLQLFKSYKGERSVKPLISLFADADISGFTQSPAIALADGKTPVRVSIVMKPTGKEMPKFMMQGGKIKQLQREGEDKVTWTIDAIPKKDAFDVKVTFVDGVRLTEYPLTVVPRINPMLAKGKILSEADFNAYLAKPPKFDFNADKKFDAVDDYIYTANYIVDMKLKPEKTVKPEKGQKPASAVKPDAKEKVPADRKEFEKGKPAASKPEPAGGASGKKVSPAKNGKKVKGSPVKKGEGLQPETPVK